VARLLISAKKAENSGTLGDGLGGTLGGSRVSDQTDPPDVVLCNYQITNPLLETNSKLTSL
jgi:hypothetical protein